MKCVYGDDETYMEYDSTYIYITHFERDCRVEDVSHNHYVYSRIFLLATLP